MNADTPSPVEPGDILASKYRVDRVLGAGGMGVVVAATNTLLNKRVALKFLLPAATASPEVLARFHREAKAAASLHSEHVAKVQDIGTLDDGAPFIVMEYLEGQDLEQLLKKNGPLPVSEAVDYVLQACEALAEAHSAGLVHRDIKPANLFLTTSVDGRPLVKVLDFGISKSVDGALGDQALTATSAMMGSPLYMSPEQMQSVKHADHRADIWALGVILYELLGGRAPFNGDTLANLLMAVIQQTPEPLETLRPDLPPGLSEVIDHTLSKLPDERPQHVGEFADLLQPYAEGASFDRISKVNDVLRRIGRFKTRDSLSGAAASGAHRAQGPGATGANPAHTAVITGPQQAQSAQIRGSESTDPGTVPQAQTAGSFGRTMDAPSVPTRKFPVGVAAAVAALLLGGVGVLALVGSNDSTPTAAAAPPPAPVADAPATTETADSIAVVPDETPTEPEASASAETPSPAPASKPTSARSPSPATAAKAPKRHAPAPQPKPTATPKSPATGAPTAGTAPKKLPDEDW